MITAKVEGIAEILRHFGKMEEEIPAAIDEYLVLCGQAVKADVKRNTPVDTGHLRRNVKTTRVFGSRRNRMLRVYDPADYAIYVENDTRTVDKKRVIKGRFMFKKAKEKHERIRGRRIGAMLTRITRAGGFK